MFLRIALAVLLLAVLSVLPATTAQVVPASAQADDTAPGLRSAVGLSRTRVRIRFTEPIAQRSVEAADVALTMGGEPRAVRAIQWAPDGASLELEATPAWPYGTAGSVRVRGSLSDTSGNVSRERPAIRVWAAPGDITAPVLTRVRLARATICIKNLSANCSVSGGTVAYTVDEPATIVLDLRRRSTDAPSLMKVSRGAGAGTVRFREKIEGRRLRPGRYRLTVTAADAAGNESRPVTLMLRVRE